jgi:electron transfer flavoprotein-quinone oxidoreductase
VRGVATDRPEGDLRAPLVILCEGVNNLLCQKLGLARRDVRPAGVALAVKQLIQLPAETIQSRFGLADSSQGFAVTLMGDLSIGLTGEGFIYSGQECLSVGLGVELDQLADHGIRPYELLERFLRHPRIAPLVAGGKLMEYGGHLIPEGGWRDMPALFADGVLVAGDAASMVNALYWEGTNMAITAGKLAAETAIAAHQRGDFSARQLAGYAERLKHSFVGQDLYHHRNLSHFLQTHPKFMDIYPSFANDALGRFFSAYGKPKKQLFKEIYGALTARRSVFNVAGDLLSLGRVFMGW